MNKETSATGGFTVSRAVVVGGAPIRSLPPCECRCGYACGRMCGFDLDTCIELHYRKQCSHKWDGPVVTVAHGASVTCSKCKLTSMEHALAVGP